MPLSRRFVREHDLPISFLEKGAVQVRVGPCSVTGLQAPKIPLDGRHYVCAGEVILRNGRRLRANFEIGTHTFDFLNRDSVWCTLDGEAWYGMNEPELLGVLCLTHDEAFPYRWQPDRPLDYHKPAPYAMHYPDETEETS